MTPAKPNQKLLDALAQLKAMEFPMREGRGSFDSIQAVREARDGGMYGMEPSTTMTLQECADEIDAAVQAAYERAAQTAETLMTKPVVGDADGFDCLAFANGEKIAAAIRALKGANSDA